MSNLEEININNLTFSSKVFPTKEDKELWASLDDHQRQAIIARDEQAGFDSGITKHKNLQDLLTEVRSEKA